MMNNATRFIGNVTEESPIDRNKVYCSFTHNQYSRHSVANDYTDKFRIDEHDISPL